VHEAGCFWHADEPLPLDAFRGCFECGHTWPTRAAYVADVHRLCDELDLPRLDDLDSCPLCAHDW
jgi:hypothetical protein